MANARELLKRRKSASNTRKITRTMELVASAKLKKAQEAADAARPYAEGLAELVGKLAAVVGDGEDSGHPLMAQRTFKKTLLLLACSDRGLCGAFNANLIRLTTDRAKELQAADIGVDIVCLGKKAGSTLRYLGFEPIAVHQGLIDAPEYSKAQELIEPMMEQFLTGDYDAVEIVYSRFISAARQVPDCIGLLPAGGAQGEEAAADSGADSDYIFHPDARSLLDSLIPQTVKTAFFSALLQTSAGEHSARRLAMKNATDAAGDLIKLLSRQYNRARQGKITQEIAEIVGAVEAMG
jgi:F-type H+-transporting ATPase subunit gamma